jgi:hypothetical protein
MVLRPDNPQDRPTTFPDRAVVEMHLRTVRAECDQPESPGDNLEIRIGRGLKYPKDSGYAKFLTERGWDRNWAGMQAAIIVEEGRIRAATASKNSEYRRALKRLANPRLDEAAFSAAAKLILKLSEETSLLRGLFDELPTTYGSSFLPALQACAVGNMSIRPHVTALAAAVWTRVRVPRGRRLNQASAAHEYFLESQSTFKPAAFTRSTESGDYTDRLTLATREEFSDWRFNPAPARRRLRAKLG